MRWKFLISILFASFTTWAVSLMDLLNITEHEVTKYESQGLANIHPYAYTKLREYYRYGKLFSSYLFVKPAERMLNLALYSVNPLGEPPTNYFLKYLSIYSYKTLLKNYPVILGRTEADFNAYMDWALVPFWKKKDYKTLEYLIKDRFVQSWITFLKSAPKPLYFVIPKHTADQTDLIFLKLLRISYYQGWIKKIVVWGSEDSLFYLKRTQILPPATLFQVSPVYENKNYILIALY